MIRSTNTLSISLHKEFVEYMAELLPEDSGIIRCICGFQHDDDFTIQCERCNAWQHATCVNINNDKAVPDNYMCPECNGTIDEVDKEQAKINQKQVFERQLELRKHLQSRQFKLDSSEGSEEDRRRRGGGRKKSVGTKLEELNSEDSASFEPQFCNVPVTENSWSDDALLRWQAREELDKQGANQLKVVSARELKSLPSISVVRRQSNKKWRFGLNDGAITVDSNVGGQKLVCEVIGEIVTRQEYVNDKLNQFTRLGCPKQGVVFVPGLPLAIDSRRRGSKSVFLYRSYQPNCKLVARRDSQDRLRVFAFTMRPVKQGEELTLGWHWPTHHPIWNASKESQILQTLLWLLDTTKDECLPQNNDTNGNKNSKRSSENIKEPDEDWEIGVKSKPPSLSWKLKRVRDLLKLDETTNLEKYGEDEDSGMARSERVWDSAKEDLPPPQKKRMSLADYMKKRA